MTTDMDQSEKQRKEQSGIKTLRGAGQILAIVGGLQFFVIIIMLFLSESFDVVTAVYSFLTFIFSIFLLGVANCLATITEIQLNNDIVKQ